MNLEDMWLEGDLPPVAASILIYSVAFFVCFVLYSISTLILPKSLHLYSADFFKTLVICTYPYGHGLIRETHGHVGYCFAAVPLVLLTQRTFEEGCSSPLAVFLEFLDKKHSAAVMAARTVVQTAAGFASYRLASVVWILELHPSHVIKLHENDCMTDLTVSVSVGFLIEMSGVTFDTIVSFLPIFKNSFLDRAVKVLNGALLVCAGVHMTGMYLHPVMASGLTFGCHGTSVLEHIFVYWVGGFLGTYIAYILHKLTYKSSKKSLSNGVHSKKEITNNNKKKIKENANYVNHTHNKSRRRKV